MYELREGDKQTLTIEVDGDFTGRDNYFTAKVKILDKERKVDLLIPDSGVSVTEGKTTFAIELEPDDTLGIKVTSLIADIESRSRTDSADVVTAWQDKVTVKISVRRDDDSLPDTIVSALVADPDDYDEGDFTIVDVIGGRKTFVKIDLGDLKNLLGIGLALGDMNQAEIDLLDTESLIKGNYVMNTSVPTIQVWGGTAWT